MTLVPFDLLVHSGLPQLVTVLLESIFARIKCWDKGSKVSNLRSINYPSNLCNHSYQVIICEIPIISLFKDHIIILSSCYVAISIQI